MKIYHKQAIALAVTSIEELEFFLTSLQEKTLCFTVITQRLFLTLQDLKVSIRFIYFCVNGREGEWRTRVKIPYVRVYTSVGRYRCYLVVD